MTIGPAPTFCEKCGKPFDEHDTLSICPGRRLIPRVAASINDLRVGMVVIVHKENYSKDEPTLVAKGTVFQPTGDQLLGIEYESPLRGWDTIYRSDLVVILSDPPPPEPVSVPADLIDALAEAVEHGLKSGLPRDGYPLGSGLMVAAQAVVAAARNGTEG